MRYLLDSNIIIEFVRHEPSRLLQRFDELPDDDAVVSTVVLSELLFGIKLSAKPEVNRGALDTLLKRLLVLSYDADAAEHYADIRFHLEKHGTPIGPMDTLIAAHARSLGVTLVTNNLREFQRVSDLRVESW
jgi:tRNA(fMet)-specific endonuclease VapC